MKFAKGIAQLVVSSALAFSALSAQATAINAFITDNGHYTSDSNTGLDWLDLTLTRNMSYNEVQQAINNGGVANDGTTSLAGWRYATGAEFDQLVTDFGYTALTSPCPNGGGFCDHQGHHQSALIETMITTLGDAYYDIDPDFWYGLGGLSGILDDESTDSENHWYATIADNNFNGLDGDIFDDVITHHDDIGVAENSRWASSFLVRTSAVPLPAAGWFFLSALFGLIARKKIIRCN